MEKGVRGSGNEPWRAAQKTKTGIGQGLVYWVEYRLYASEAWGATCTAQRPTGGRALANGCMQRARG